MRNSMFRSSVSLIAFLVFSTTIYAMAPDAPTNVVAAPAGATSTSAKIYFTAPDSNGGSPITSYTATSSPGGLKATYIGSGSNSVIVTGLESGTTYTFTVTCTNGVVSPPSLPSSKVTPIAFTTVTYSGPMGGEWANEANWTPRGIPTIDCDVTIPANKSVIIAAGTTVNINSLNLSSSGATVINKGILNIVPRSDGKNALSFASGTFTNGSEAILNVNTSLNLGFCVGLGGSAESPNTLSLDGTISFITSSMDYQYNQYIFNVYASSNSIFKGDGFTLGSIDSPVRFGVFKLSGSITLNSGFNFTYYGQTDRYSPFFMGSNSRVINSGNISLTSIPIDTGLGTAINTYESSNQTATFNNFGVLTGTGWDKFISLSGSRPSVIPWGTNTFNNTGVLNIVNCNKGIVGSTNTVNNITNSGTMNISCNTSSASAILMGTSATVIGEMTQSNGSLTNTGTVTITKGIINGQATDATKYANIANNAGGIINFKFTTSTKTPITALDKVLLINSGGTISGSCTFPANTFESSTGTISPGDNGVEIGTIVLTPSAVGISYNLTGNLNIKVNGKTTAGLDFDQLICSELNVNDAVLKATLGFVPSTNVSVNIVYSKFASKGKFRSTILPSGWLIDYSDSTRIKITTPKSVPDAPTNVTAIASEEKARIYFCTSINNGGSPIISYTLTSNPGNIQVSGTSSPLTVSGLTNGLNYTFTVTATNSIGISHASVASNSVTPTKQFVSDHNTALENWKDMRLGLFIHWGPVSQKPEWEISWSRNDPRFFEPVAGVESNVAEYDNLWKTFNPVKFDASTWISMVKNAGFSYIVFVCKHHDGFSMFGTDLSSYKITDSPFGRDPLAELSAECHKQGIGFGVYYSPMDWWNPIQTTDQRTYLEKKAAGLPNPRYTPATDAYRQYLKGQVRELCTNYGSVNVMWFDGGSTTNIDNAADSLVAMVRQLQPGAIVNGRAYDKGRGDFDTPERIMGDFNVTRPWEMCQTIAGGWSYRADNPKDLDILLLNLIWSACGDGNFLLNMGPMSDGTFDPVHIARFNEIGNWLKLYSSTIKGTRGGPFQFASYGGSTYKGNHIYLHVLFPDNGSFRLPVINRNIVKLTCLTSGKASLHTSHDSSLGAIIQIDEKPALGEVDMILDIELDGNVADMIITKEPQSVTLNKTCTASSNSSVASNVCTKVHSGWSPDITDTNQWIEVNVGKMVEVSSAYLSVDCSHNSGPGDFEVQAKIGGVWVVVGMGNSQYERTFITMPTVNAQYFRLHIKDKSSFTVWEFQLYESFGDIVSDITTENVDKIRVFSRSQNIYVNFPKETQASIEIIDLMGKTQKSVNVGCLTNIILVPSLRGIYLVKIKTPNFSGIYKLII